MGECAGSATFIIEEGLHGATLAAVFLAVLTDRAPLLRINANLTIAGSRALMLRWAQARLARGYRTGILRAHELEALAEEVQNATA